MNEPSKALNAARPPTFWRRLLGWLTEFERAVDFDPQEYTYANIRQLKEQTRKLDARLRDLEGRSR